jgi:hypothetical protein
MPITRKLFFVISLLLLLNLGSSCRIWNNLFKSKYGCPSNGKNIGAEKIISGDPEAMKAMKKAKKFRS